VTALAPYFSTSFTDVTLTFSGVNLSFGTQTLFENASASISSGTLMWVAGENGVGKTTLLRSQLDAERSKPKRSCPD